MAVSKYQGKVRDSVDLAVRQQVCQSISGEMSSGSEDETIPSTSWADVVPTRDSPVSGLLRRLAEKKVAYPRKTIKDVASDYLRSTLIREPIKFVADLFFTDPETAFAVIEAAWMLDRSQAIPELAGLLPSKDASDLYRELHDSCAPYLGPLSCLFYQESDDSSGRLFLQDKIQKKQRDGFLISIVMTRTTFPISLNQAKFLLSASGAVDKEIKELIALEVGNSTVENAKRIVDISSKCNQIYDELVSQRAARTATGPVQIPSAPNPLPEVNMSEYHRVLEEYLRSPSVGANTRKRILEGGLIPAPHRAFFRGLAVKLLGDRKADILVALHCASSD